MRLCFDIDGVIGIKEKLEGMDLEINNIEKLPTNKKIIAKINKLYKDHRIILLTSRPAWMRALTNLWLNRNKVKFHELHHIKPVAELYIDDRAIRPDEFLRRKI